MANLHLLTRDFEAKVIDRPIGEPEHTFAAPGADARALTVEIKPDGNAGWVGTFAAPSPGARALTSLCEAPTIAGLCVVERGTAFLGDAREPESFSALGLADPIIDVK